MFFKKEGTKASWYGIANPDLSTPTEFILRKKAPKTVTTV